MMLEFATQGHSSVLLESIPVSPTLSLGSVTISKASTSVVLFLDSSSDGATSTVSFRVISINPATHQDSSLATQRSWPTWLYACLEALQSYTYSSCERTSYGVLASAITGLKASH